MNQSQQPMWGVVGLTEAEQRGVRGGSCTRDAYLTYIQNLRDGISRSSARSTLVSQLQSCGVQ